MRAFLKRFRFNADRPSGFNADGRMMGLGLAMAMRKNSSADEAERHLRHWTTEQRVNVRK
jgi:xanthine dehydrogenase molybdopterin-binding subunit B